MKGAGVNGDNSAYVRNTYEHLQRLNIHDAQLAQVVRHLDRNASTNTPS
jgi:cation transport protein ChaC